MLNRRMPNGMYGGVRGERKSPLLNCKGAGNMTEAKNEQQPHSFKRKLGNTTYTVKVHFSKDTDKTFKDRVQKLIINECLEKNQK